MFDFAFSEIALIGVVALIAIGPKDMPVAVKAISDTVKKLRRMAGEFQGHVDEMLRDADLGDVKTSIDELRSLNPRSMVQRAIDPDGSVRSAFADPFRDKPVRPVMARLDQHFTAEQIAQARTDARPTAAIAPPEAGALAPAAAHGSMPVPVQPPPVPSAPPTAPEQADQAQG